MSKGGPVAIKCTVCETWSTIPRDWIPVPVPGLRAHVHIDESDGYRLVLSDLSRERHAHTIIPGRLTPGNVEEAINEAICVLSALPEMRSLDADREEDRIVELLQDWRERLADGRDRVVHDGLVAAINIIRHGSPVPQGASR